MEPAEFEVFRNAPAGVQALMKSQSPQYSLDMGSVVIYGIAGNTDKATEAARAVVTSPEYWRDTALSLAGAVAVEATAAKAGANSSVVERGLGSTSGHEFAATVTEGGSGQALAGHGAMDGTSVALGTSQYVSPSGTWVVTPRPGITIADSTGRILENVTSVEHLENILSSGIGPNGQILAPRNFIDLAGYNVVAPGETGYNYTLLNPSFQNKPLNIFSKSTTTNMPTQLSNFLEPNMGCVFWAACTQALPFIPTR